MAKEHIDLLTGVNGYTIRRCRGNLKNHLTDGLGSSCSLACLGPRSS
jgi:hypothetical protein